MNNNDPLIDLIKEQQKEFEVKHKNMPKPKYRRGDKVRFCIGENEDILEGEVRIIDKYGTFEQNEEPSYDIYRLENNTLYKHIRQSSIIERVKETKKVLNLTQTEAKNVAEFIESYLLESIRNDPDIDNLMWLFDMMHAFEKLCEYSGYESMYKPK